MTETKTVELPLNLVVAIANFLGKCPWVEVNEILAPTLQILEESQKPAPEAKGPTLVKETE